jgi:hypothetical protein
MSCGGAVPTNGAPIFGSPLKGEVHCPKREFHSRESQGLGMEHFNRVLDFELRFGNHWHGEGLMPIALVERRSEPQKWW